MQISLQQFEQVLLLDRLRHFGQAAESIGMSQPAFSRSLKRIESEIGARLFERSRSGVEPTATGRAVIEFARQVLEQSDTLQKQVRALMQSQRQFLSLACGFYPAALSLPEALADLTRELPALTLELEVVEWHRALDYAADGTVELALCEVDEARNYPTLAAAPLGQHALYFMARKGHPLAGKRSPNRQALLSFPWVCARLPARAAALLGSAPTAAGAIDHRTGYFMPAVTSPSIGTAIRLVAGSDLLTPLPLSAAAESIDSGTLDFVRCVEPWMRLNYGFVWRRGASLSPGAQAFMTRLRAVEQRVAERERILAARFGCDRWDPRMKQAVE